MAVPGRFAARRWWPALRGSLPRVTGESGVWSGLLLYLLVAIAPTVLIWLCVRGLPAWLEAWRERYRARHRAPVGPTLEQAVADVRRLRVAVHRPGRTHVRHVATRQAYDESLAVLCGVLGLPAPALDGPDRAFDRLLAEAAIEEAGVALDPPPGPGGALS